MRITEARYAAIFQALANTACAAIGVMLALMV
jgi:hypothetical protein